MIKTDSDHHLLYIEPKSMLVEAPVDDELTRGMEALLAQSRGTGSRWRGYHTCACGVKSSNTDYLIGAVPMQVNSLCVHYIRMHRSEVPLSEFTKLVALMKTYGLKLPDSIPAFEPSEPAPLVAEALTNPWDSIPDGTYQVDVLGGVRSVHVVRPAVPEIIIEFPGGPGTLSRPDLVSQMAERLLACDDPRIGRTARERFNEHQVDRVAAVMAWAADDIRNNDGPRDGQWWERLRHDRPDFVAKWQEYARFALAATDPVT